MLNTISLAALIMFTVAPFAALSFKTHSTRLQIRKSERAWELVAKFIV
jgi:hypothetical protein